MTTQQELTDTAIAQQLTSTDVHIERQNTVPATLKVTFGFQCNTGREYLNPTKEFLRGTLGIPNNLPIDSAVGAAIDWIQMTLPVPNGTDGEKRLLTELATLFGKKPEEIQPKSYSADAPGNAQREADLMKVQGRKGDCLASADAPNPPYLAAVKAAVTRSV